MSGLAAVLLDLDGTLAGTEPLWRGLYRDLADTLGVPLTDGWWARVIGRDLESSVEVVAGRHVEGPARRDALVAWLVDRGVARLRASSADPDDPGLVTWRPGARELVGALHLAGVPIAVVTAGPRRFLDAVVDHLGLAATASVAGDEVARSKPHPDGYHRAARLLGVDIAHCVAIEDSPTGVQAAEASGARVLAVPSGIAIAAAPTRTVTASLEGIDARALATLPGRG